MSRNIHGRIAEILLLLTCFSGCSAEDNSGDALPNVAIEPAEIVLRKAEGVERIPFELRLKNLSLFPVAVARVKTSCGCTTVDRVNAAPIGPGESIAISLAAEPGQVAVRTVSIEIQTDPPMPEPLTATCILTPPPLRNPRILSRIEPRWDLVGHEPNSALVRRFSFETFEEDQREPWIGGVQGLDGSEIASLEVVSSEKIRDVQPGWIHRRYVLEIAGRIPPRAADAPTATFRLMDREGTEVDLPYLTVSLSLVPVVKVIPERLEWNIGKASDREFAVVSRNSDIMIESLEFRNVPEWLEISARDRTDEASAMFRLRRFSARPISPPAESDPQAISIVCQVEGHEVAVPLQLVVSRNGT